MKTILKLSACIAALFAVSSAHAGNWNVFADRSGGEVVVVTSFTGDGASDEAQLDVAVGQPFTVSKVETLLPGSVCIAPAEKGFLRAVPPSGAGTPLPSVVADVCVFTLRLQGVANPTVSVDNSFRVQFAECVSSKSGPQACGTNFHGPAVSRDRGNVHER